MIYLNGKPVKPTLFPDQTSQIWKVPEEQINLITENYIIWDFDHEGEFLHIAQLKSLIDAISLTYTYLTMSYLPYARQDKPISNESTFALRTFAGLLNSLKFDGVGIVDPHSEIALEVINNSKAVYPTYEVELAYHVTNSDIVCYPDKGAKNKYSNIYNFPFFHAKKVRNQSTGEITSIELVDKKTTMHNILIVDDLIDGGGTFIGLAKKLYEIEGVKEVNLFATHGIFSKGLKPLKDANIKHIFTKDGEISEVQGNIVYKKLT